MLNDKRSYLQYGGLAVLLFLLFGMQDLLFKAGVNLRKLESRPLRSQSWKYAFFADLETNLLKPELSGVLAELRNTCHSFRLLGCYTAGE